MTTRAAWPAFVFLLAAAAPSGPEPPRARVDTSWVAPSGRTLSVPAGEDLQAALDAARPGDQITLQAGATYTGPFTLPKKSGDEWVLIRTSAAEPPLPSPGERVGPAHARHMPKLVAGSGSVITARPGAHHYRFVGVEIAPSPGVFLTNVVLLGAAEESTALLPHHIIFDRCYIHGDRAAGSRRGIAMNSAHTAVIDSYLSDFTEVGGDSQAVCGWNGTGPFLIEGNYLEAAGENVMFGGADPVIRDLVPSDIEIRRNYFSKPLTWKIGDPSFEGTPWSVKNLFELKNARRVLIEGNAFARSWAHAQSGFAILFTVRNQDGSAPWSVVEDVRFANNVVRDSASGINILGRDDGAPSGQAKRIAITNNLFEDIGAAAWGGGGTLFQILNGTSDVIIENNTAVHTGTVIMAEGTPHARFAYRRNITSHNSSGIAGTGTGAGKATLEAYFPGALVEANVLAGGEASLYPAGNFFPPSLKRVDLPAASSGGKPIGVDVRALCAALAPIDRPAAHCGPGLDHGPRGQKSR